MSKDTSYQRVRSHLAYLKLQSAAERLAPALEAAERDRPAYADFLDGLLGDEVVCALRSLLMAQVPKRGLDPHRDGALGLPGG